MDVTRLKQLRCKAGLTQAELANAFGFSAQRYNYYETGKNEPDNETLLKIAQYFDVSTDYLLGNTGDPTPPDKKNLTFDGEVMKNLKEIHDILDRLSPEEQEAVLRFARFQANEQSQ